MVACEKPTFEEGEGGATSSSGDVWLHLSGIMPNWTEAMTHCSRRGMEMAKVSSADALSRVVGFLGEGKGQKIKKK